MRHLIERKFVIVIGLLFVLVACDDSTPDDPSAPTTPAPASVAVEVNAQGFGTDDLRSPNSFRLRVVGTDGSTLREVTGAFSEDPNRVFGPYQVPVPEEGIAGVRAEVEILWRADDQVVVMWSGRTGEVNLNPGTRTDVSLTVYRGALANLGLTSVSISGVPSVMGIGESFDGSAVGDPSGTLSQPAWGSLDPSIASVDAAGRVTGHAEGTARIIVAAGPVSDTVEVEVRPLVDAISIEPGSLTFGSLWSTATVEATVTSFRGDVLPDHPVEWSVSSPGVVTVSQAGVVRATSNGSVEVRATAGDVTASIPVEVSQIAAALVIRPPFATLNPGEELDFTGRVEDAGGSRIDGFDLEWSSSDTEVFTVDADGRVTALRVGEAVLTLSADTLAATAEITVEAGELAALELVSGGGQTAEVGETLPEPVIVRALDDAGFPVPGVAVAWSASGDGSTSETITTTNIDGLTGVEWTLGSQAGTQTLTASAGGVTLEVDAEAELSVASVVVTPETASLDGIGATQQFTAEARNADGEPVSGFDFAWSSSDDGVVAVDAATGLATANGTGTATVTATTEGISGSATVTVEQNIVSIVVTPADATLDAIGVDQTFSAEARDAEDNPIPGVTFTWASDDTDVAEITSGGVATSTGNGVATISASVGGVTGSTSLTVEQSVASVVVSPDPFAFEAVGAEQEFTAVAEDSQGNAVAGVTFTWASSDTDVVTIDATSGMATSVADGSATITATGDGVEGTAEVTVGQVAATVEVTPATESVEPGETLQLSATVRDSEGEVIPGASVTWSSEDVTLATVDTTGLVTGQAEGTVIIEATSGGATGQMTLTVTAPTPANIAVEAGDGQAAPAGLTLSDSLQVRVTSAFGYNVDGASVSWEPQDGGSATPATSITDGDGLTSTSWTLGSELGAQTLRAAIDGDTVTFTATAEGASRVFDRSNEADQIILDNDQGALDFPDSDWTLSMWVRPDDLSVTSVEDDFQMVFSAGPSPFDPGIYLYFNPDPDFGMERWHARHVHGGPSGNLFADPIEGEWQHLLLRRSGTTVTFWMNGIQIPGSFEASGAIAPATDARLGVAEDFGGWFHGGIAQVTRWSSALTSGEIGDLAGGTHPLDLASGSLDWFLPLGRDPEVVDGSNFGVSPFGTEVGGAPPVSPPTNP